MDTVEKLLNRIGLLNQEAKVYLSSLKLGACPASHIAKDCGLARSTATFNCEQLVKKGLLKVDQKAHIRYFGPLTPERLRLLIKAREEELREREKKLDIIMHDLKQRYNPYSRLPKVRYFEGMEGLAQIYAELSENLDECTEFLVYLRPLNISLSKQEGSWKIFKPIYEKWRKRSFASNVNERIIIPDSKEARVVKGDLDWSYNREVRIGDVKNFDFLVGELIIAGDKVYSIAVDGDYYFGYVFENKHLAQLQRSIFEIAWVQAGIDDKKQ